jgi:hypothetical protein
LKAHHKLGYEIHPEGARRCLCGIIEQAVHDLRRFQKRGWVVGGRINREKFQAMRTCGDRVKTCEIDVKQLLHFFSTEGPMDRFIVTLHLKISPDKIRQQLKLV